MGRGSSGARGEFAIAEQRAKTATRGSQVVYSADDSRMGETYQRLSPANKMSIQGVLSITKDDFDFFNEYRGRNVSQTRSVRIGKDMFRIDVEADGRNFSYTVKKRNKVLVKKGTFANAANLLATSVMSQRQ